MNLTVTEIKEDITGYEDRIDLARLKLSELPEGYLPFKQHRARERRRRDLQAEIEHVKQLIIYANEGIELRLKEPGVSCG